MVKREEGASKKLSQREMQEILVENFVGLQKAMTNLSIKFEGLSDQIRSLLELFESAAKSFASKAPESNDREEVLEKVNILLEQNKIIARGVVLLEEKLKVKMDQQPQTNSFASPQQNSEESNPSSQKPRQYPKI